MGAGSKDGGKRIIYINFAGFQPACILHNEAGHILKSSKCVRQGIPDSKRVMSRESASRMTRENCVGMTKSEWVNA